MSEDDFRKLALSLPAAEEGAHMGHPDFRVRGKIFATLGKPGAGVGMAKLTPELQRDFLRTDPRTFYSVSGAWGRGGATGVRLEVADEDAVRRALRAAWRHTAPKGLTQQLPDDDDRDPP
jgi:hypothetical protein